MTHRLNDGRPSPTWPLLPKGTKRAFRRRGLISGRQQRMQTKAQKRELKAGQS